MSGGSKPTDGCTPEIYEAGEYDSIDKDRERVKLRKLADGNK